MSTPNIPNSVITGYTSDGRPIWTAYAPGNEASIASPSSPTPPQWFNVPQQFYFASDFGDMGLASQRAATAAAASGNGGVLYYPGELYNFKSGFTVAADNIQIRGDGYGSIFQVDSGWSSGAGPLIWYQQPNSAFRRGCILRDFSINGQNVAALQTVIRLDGVRHADINHIEVHNAPASVAQLYMFGNQNGGSYGAYNVVRGCTFRDSYTGVGVYLQNSEWCTFVGNEFVLFNQSGSIALYLQGGLNCNVVGNQFDAMDTAVYLNFCNYTNVTGNQFDEGNSQWVKAKAAQYCTVVGNTFSSRTGFGTGAIFWDLFGSNNVSNLIANNTFKAGQSWTYFYQETNSGGSPTGAGNLIVNNQSGGYGVSLITGTARGNQGLNPIGKLSSQPGIPSSGTPYTNTSGYDCDVFITGGTVSAIAIGGNTTGLTAGSFRVASGQSITLTYSVAPSWLWFGE